MPDLISHIGLEHKNKTYFSWLKPSTYEISHTLKGINKELHKAKYHEDNIEHIMRKYNLNKVVLSTFCLISSIPTAVCLLSPAIHASRQVDKFKHESKFNL